MQKENVKHIWSVLCESSVVDQQTNNVSIHKVLEQLNIDLTLKNKDSKENKIDTNQIVAITFPFQIVSLWQRINPKKAPTIDVFFRYPIAQS